MLSYTEVSEADLFFSGRQDALHWQTLKQEEKEHLLEQATRILDSAFDWNGEPSGKGQPMRWPRKNVSDLDGQPVNPETIPLRIKHAVSEQALFLMNSGFAFPSDGIKSASLGEMSLSFDSSRQKELLSPAAVSCVRGLGKLGSSMKKLARNGTLMRG